METIVPQLFTDTASDRPDEGVGAVKGLFDSLHNGAYTKQDGKQRFFVLGLSPNASRIAVRFWQVGTVASFAERLGQWFNDIDVGIEGRRYPPIKALLRSTALLGKDENLPPHLVGETVRTILAGLPLPASVLQAVIKRIRSEQGYVSSHRAALIKACLNRKARYNYRAEEEISMGHNPEEKRIGYRLGCLFAVLEKLQKEANPNLNATIRDKYYSSASCTPSSVFGTLMRLHTHHLKKMENSRFREAAQRRIAEVVWEIGEFPAHLSLEDQGLFAIGYYHQRQAFFTKKNDRAGTELRAESELA